MSNLVCMQTLLNLNLCFILQPQLLFILMELLKKRLSHHILLSKINWIRYVFTWLHTFFILNWKINKYLCSLHIFCKKLKLACTMSCYTILRKLIFRQLGWIFFAKSSFEIIVWLTKQDCMSCKHKMALKCFFSWPYYLLWLSTYVWLVLINFYF